MGGDELWLSRKPFNIISEYGKSISQVLRKRSVLIAKSTESTSPCCWKPTWFPYPPRFSLIRFRQLGMMILTFFRGVKTTNQLHSISTVFFSIILGKVIPQFTELCWVWLNHQWQSFNDGPLLLPGFITHLNSKLTPWYSNTI